MSRFHLALALLAAFLIIGSYLLFSEALPQSDGPLDYDGREEPGGPELGPRDGGDIRLPRPIETEALPTEKTSVTELEEEDIDSEEFGALRGKVTTEDGEDPGVLGIAFAPQGGLELKNVGGVFEVVRLRPGSYKVTVWGADYVAETLHDVTISAGKRKNVSLGLQRGVRPRGRVIDDTDQTPISDAEVVFRGGLRVRTDASGTFEAPYPVLKSALGEIRLRHPDYDDVVQRNLPAQDLDAMVLAMSRGKAFLNVRLVNLTGTPWPARGRIRLTRHQGGTRRHLKREAFFDPKKPYLFRRIHIGDYEVSVDFPGKAFAQRIRPVRVDRIDDPIDLEIRFAPGTRIEGQLQSRGAVVAGRKVELVTKEGVVMGSVTSKPDGSFVIPGVEPGTYYVKVWMGMPCFNTPAVEISGEKPRSLIIDCDRQLFAN